MRGSLGGLPLRSALTRGAWVTAANWPVVLLQFVVVSAYRLAVAVPVIGGIFVTAVLVGGDARTWFALDWRAAIGLVVAALAHRPEALVTFLVSVGVVAVGGASVVFLAQAGASSVLTAGERQAASWPRGAGRPGVWRTAAVFSVPLFMDGIRRFGRRFLVLGAWLCVSYTLLGSATLSALWVWFGLGGSSAWLMAEGIGVLLTLAAAVVTLVGLNLVYALLQVIVVTDDCRLSQAVARLHAFVRHDARQVAGVFGVVLGLLLLASAASLLATAGLTLIAWVPLVGLAVVPLQLAAWLLRGLVFHYMELGAWSAYQSQYHHYVNPAADAPSSLWVQRA